MLDRSTPSLERGRRRYHTLAARCPPRESSKKPRGWETVSHVAGDPPTVCFGYTPTCRSVRKLPIRTLRDGEAYGAVAVTQGDA